MLNTMELSADWAPSGNIAIVVLTIAIIITASRTDKYKTNVTFFSQPLLQLPVRDLSLPDAALCSRMVLCS